MIQIARALVTQRQAISALAGITFSFDPQIATLATFPRSLITVKTPNATLRGFTMVPFVATERLTCDPKDQIANDFEDQLGLLTRSIVAAPIYLSRACRIHAQDRGPEVLSFTGSAREALITWAGWASWEPRPTFALSVSTATVLAAGAAGLTFSVVTTLDGTWTAIAADAWITVTGGASGTGSGTVTYTVGVNSGIARTGTISVAGLTFTVSQAAV